MHMEAFDRSYSSTTTAEVPALYPITPDSQYNDCISPQYSPIQYDDQLYCNSPRGTPMLGYSQHTPLSSVSSYSSDNSSSSPSCLSSSHSSGLSEIPSLSSMSISSSEGSSCSLFSTTNDNNNTNNPFIAPTTTVTSRSSNKKVRSNARRINNINDNVIDPSIISANNRRSSAPARSITSSNTAAGINSSNNSDIINSCSNRFISKPTKSPATRKDSFVYDVQLESDNVLLFVPDLDLVKSHLMLAVREEVDVLKEKIGELMEKISHLEYENSVLKKYASPEAMQQLQQPNP